MSYEEDRAIGNGEIYDTEPTEDELEHIADEHSGIYDEDDSDVEHECPRCGNQIFIHVEGEFECDMCGSTGYYYGE